MLFYQKSLIFTLISSVWLLSWAGRAEAQRSEPDTASLENQDEAAYARQEELEALRLELAAMREALDEAAARAEAEKLEQAAEAEAQQAEIREELDASIDEKLEEERRARREIRKLAPGSHEEYGYDLGKGFFLSSYVQGQYEWHQDSEDAVSVDGDLLNQNRFLLRRGRIKLAGDYRYGGVNLELDMSTTAGDFRVAARRAEAYLQYKKSDDALPLIQVGAGVVDTRFGYDIATSSRARLFMERSLMVRSIWPDPADAGVSARGAYKWLRYSFQVLNGEPRNSPSGFPGLNPTSSTDFIARLGADAPVNERFSISGNVSFLQGKGFAPGRTATKGRLDWSDSNEDGVVQNAEIRGVPSRSAAPSLTFNRWAAGLDLQLRLKTRLGTSTLYGEAILAENMDRALYVSNPIRDGLNQRMFGYYVAFTQEFTKWAIAGFRFDYYDPHSDLFESRAGVIHHFDQSIRTYSMVAGFQLPERARLLLQYDIIRDNYGRDSVGVPMDLSNNTLTLRLQVQL